MCRILFELNSLDLVGLIEPDKYLPALLYN